MRERDEREGRESGTRERDGREWDTQKEEQAAGEVDEEKRRMRGEM